MGYLISEILLYLILAALIGGVIGWILKSFFCGDCEAEINEWRTKYSALEGRYASLEANASASSDDSALRAKISGLEETNGLQADRIADLEGRLTDGSAASEADAELAAENARLKAELDGSNKKLAAAAVASAAAGAAATKAASGPSDAEAKLTTENKQLKADLAASQKGSKKLEADLAACAKKTASLEAAAANSASASATAKAAPAAKKSAKKEVFTTDAPAPKGLLKKANGTKDDLKKIWGVGPVMEGVMNKLGIFHFKQVAELSDRDVEWVSANIGTFPDRIKRDEWVKQAGELHKKHHG